LKKEWHWEGKLYWKLKKRLRMKENNDHSKSNWRQRMKAINHKTEEKSN
jgi:hypothetical protein